jgi:hypothetical protein
MEKEANEALQGVKSLTDLDDRLRKVKFTGILALVSDHGDKEERIFENGKVISMDILRDK